MTLRQKFAADKRQAAIALIALLWMLMWGFIVLNLNIEWQRFSLTALIAALVIIDYRQGRFALPPLARMRCALLFLVFFFLFCLLAAILLLIDEHSLRMTRNWLTFCVIGFGAFHYLGWKGLSLGVVGICTGVIISTSLLLLHAHFPEYSILKPTYPAGLERLALYMDHPNNLGTVMGWGCCLWFFIRRNKRQVVQGRLDWLLLLIMAVPLCLSWSRSNIFATVITVIFIAVTMPRPSLKSLSLALAAIVAILLAAHQLPLPEHSQLRRVAAAIQSPLEVSTIHSRLPIWEVAWHGYKQSPVYGNGLKSYRRLHNEYLAEHGDELRKKYPIVEVDKKRAHSLVLGVMSDMGSLGLAFLIGMYVFAILAAFKLPALFKAELSALLFIFAVGLVESVLSETGAAMILFSSCGGMLAGYFQEPGRAGGSGPRAK